MLFRSDFLDVRAGAATYREQSDSGRLWAESGLGVLDIPAILAALPSDYDGDVMIEVDHPSTSTKRESHELSYAWARENLPALV